MGNTSVPDACDGLYDCLKAWPALAAVYVSDGELTGDFDPLEFIAVAFNDEGPFVEGEQRPAELGAFTRREVFTIRNTVSVAAGNNDERSARRRAYDIFNEIENALRANPEFAGTSTYSDIRAFDCVQDDTVMGDSITIHFAVMFHDYGSRF